MLIEPQMHRIVFLERNTINADFRRPDFDHDWIEFADTAPEEVVERVRDATIIISNKLVLGTRELEAARRVGLIAIAATGSDCVDLQYCRERGIAVCNVRGYAVNSVPEHVLMMVLALRRNLIAFRRDVEDGLWQQSKQFCLLTHDLHDVRGSTLGIIGYGSIGRAVARLGRGVGMKTIVAEHKGAKRIRKGRTPFYEMIQAADVLTLHCPLTDETRDLIGRSEFEMMKPGALLINTARGALVQEIALIEALERGRIAGAAVDVLRDEPPVAGNPLLDIRRHNFIVTPHVAWASNEAMKVLADQVIDNIEAFVRGEPRNLLTPES